MTSQSPHKETRGEGGTSPRESRESFQLTVKQPAKITSLLAVLSDLEKISERVSEDRSTDLGAGTSTALAGASATQSGELSARQQALQALPAKEVMQRKVTKHLKKEIHHLEREARHLARLSTKGSAHLLTQTYARIRKIQTLIEDLLDAAYEVIERLYVRLFVDQQQLV